MSDQDVLDAPAPAPAPYAPPAPAPAPPAPAPAPAPTPDAPVAFDYAKWADSLPDANKKDYAKRFKGLDDVLDSQIELRKELSSRVKVPGKDAKPEDIAAFRKAIGASDKAEDYKAALPENYELGDVQTALLSQMQKAAAETGVPAASFSEFTKTYFEMEQAVQAKCAEEVATFQRDSTAALKKEFGQDFDKYVRSAENFIDTKLQVPEFIELLNDKIQWNGVTIELRSHPAIVKTMAQIGLRAGEGGIIGHSPDERSSIQEQIAKLEKDYPVGQRTRQQDAQIRELYVKLYD